MAKDKKLFDDKLGKKTKTAEREAVEQHEAAQEPEESFADHKGGVSPLSPDGAALVKAAIAAQDAYQQMVGLLEADAEIEQSDLKDTFRAVAEFLAEFSDVPPAAIPIELKRRGLGGKALQADDAKSLLAWEAFTAVFRVALRLFKEQEAPPAQTGKPEPIPARQRGKIRPEAYAVTGYSAKK